VLVAVCHRAVVVVGRRLVVEEAVTTVKVAMVREARVGRFFR